MLKNGSLGTPSWIQRQGVIKGTFRHLDWIEVVKYNESV